MLEPRPCPLAWLPRPPQALPAAGRQVLVTVRKTSELWQGSRRVRYCAGEALLGTVVAVGDDGLLDLQIAGGQPMRLYARDGAFAVAPHEG